MKAILEVVEAERATLAEARAYLDERERALDEIAGAASQIEPLVFRPAREPKAKAPARVRKGRAKREAPRGLPPVRRTQPEPPRPRPTADELDARVQRVLDGVRDLEPVRFGDLVRQTGLGIAQVKRGLESLRDAGSVRMTGVKAGAKWNLTETLDRQTAERYGKGADHGGRRRATCREDCLQTIKSEPGAWSEERMASVGVWEREQIAEACGALLDDDEISLGPDGTYRPRLAEAVAA